MSTPLAVATTTWNSGDLIGIFLSHYRKLGFKRAFVMDFDSTDATRSVLLDPEWDGFVELVPYPGIAGLDSSNILLARAKEAAPTDSWCLFCDPDELLVTPEMEVPRTGFDGMLTGADWILLPRFNVTALRTTAESDERRLTALDALTLRIARGHSRVPDRDIDADTLVPAWIFSDVQGKVLVRLSSALRVGEGDHTIAPYRHPAAAPVDTFLLHYPFRTFSAFAGKVDLARRGFEANPHLSRQHGWQVRRWIALADAGHLHREFLDQFVPAEELDRLLSDGIVDVVRSVVEFHRGMELIA